MKPTEEHIKEIAELLDCGELYTRVFDEINSSIEQNDKERTSELLDSLKEKIKSDNQPSNPSWREHVARVLYLPKVCYSQTNKIPNLTQGLWHINPYIYVTVCES